MEGFQLVSPSNVISQLFFHITLALQKLSVMNITSDKNILLAPGGEKKGLRRSSSHELNLFSLEYLAEDKQSWNN